ncbi:hypothetical protein AE929_20135 [Xanthomonas arboricola]|uniref:Secreted protein n=1 Tax=Xanthomonas campestris pv. juglandis TaxID=195709 RepID=A0A7U7HJF6_XANCJ|nr:hypothetical protein [Xanthomonas arboricola]KOB02091.1 hypothetical protein AE920_04050 [Xanthomonas arboricola]KOB18007.1 hypothetical protein AE924_02390 [Xanthomonas arboricola]KOB31838.1 hypothetical protein AE929_20135 [Xanthomonas arboricola]OAH84033.1 hypothetical protein AXA70_01870 [Xanthomonas arboricola pv. juglandis]CAD1786892.1 hypothetical protein XSP_000402 [Xanthomonas arboricola pv. juglandis]
MRHHRRMPSLLTSLLRSLPLLSALLLPMLAAAQTSPAPAAAAPAAAPAVTPGTGDAWVDQHLADMGSYAQRYPDSFIGEVARYTGTPRGYVQALLQVHGWHAGDIYFACFWAQTLQLSCRDTVRAYSRDHHDGWEGVITRLSVMPDTVHMRALRHAIVASYDRWERPITLDALLRRQLGDHAQRLEAARQASEAAEAAAQAGL